VSYREVFGELILDGNIGTIQFISAQKLSIEYPLTRYAGVVYPIPYHPSWEIVDASKLNNFLECERKYFYAHILGWQGELPSLHLEFGKAWHLAMAHLLVNGYGEVSLLEAYMKLTAHYRQFFPEMVDITNDPKTPTQALAALREYVKVYKDEKFIPIYTEISGSVPMDETHRIFFKIDSIIEVDGLIRSREHKSGTTLNRQWEDQWVLSMQTGVYSHVLYCLYPKEKVWGVEMNGTFFLKTMKKFKRVPARRNMEMMNVWYWTALDHMYKLDWEMSRLAECKKEDPVMMCFPMRSTSCTNWFGCAYHDFCMVWANPLQHCYEPPMGFRQKYWDPREDEEKAKKIMHFDKVQRPEEAVR
jgi:hypothetical protein